MKPLFPIAPIREAAFDDSATVVYMTVIDVDAPDICRMIGTPLLIAVESIVRLLYNR